MPIPYEPPDSPPDESPSEELSSVEDEADDDASEADPAVGPEEVAAVAPVDTLSVSAVSTSFVDLAVSLWVCRVSFSSVVESSSTSVASVSIIDSSMPSSASVAVTADRSSIFVSIVATRLTRQHRRGKVGRRGFAGACRIFWSCRRSIRKGGVTDECVLDLQCWGDRRGFFDRCDSRQRQRRHG